MVKKYHLAVVAAAFILAGCATQQVCLPGEGFWKYHTLLQLLGWMFFPRLMFWFFSAVTGGFGFWLGVFFVPRIMAAWWACVYYWETNPCLCIGAWLWALAGEGAEKKAVRR